MDCDGGGDGRMEEVGVGDELRRGAEVGSRAQLLDTCFVSFNCN